LQEQFSIKKCQFYSVIVQLQLASSRVQSNITQISTEPTSMTMRWS